MDWRGRELRADKRGAIPAELLPILERLKIQPESWLDVIVNYDAKFRTAVGRVAAIRRSAGVVAGCRDSRERGGHLPLTASAISSNECEMLTTELAPTHRMILKLLRVPEASPH